MTVVRTVVFVSGRIRIVLHPDPTRHPDPGRSLVPVFFNAMKIVNLEYYCIGTGNYNEVIFFTIRIRIQNRQNPTTCLFKKIVFKKVPKKNNGTVQDDLLNNIEQQFAKILLKFYFNVFNICFSFLFGSGSLSIHLKTARNLAYKKHVFRDWLNRLMKKY